MEISISELRAIIRQVIEEDMKNVGGRHEKTVAGSAALRKMHDAPGVLDALAHIQKPEELTQVLQATIDAVPVTKRGDVMRAVNKVARHQKSTHKR